ncbi:MAG: RNA methyltransferase [Bacteroidales bacterium]|nr:RNA methyltransferase [Bacteroidales bacterium]
MVSNTSIRLVASLRSGKQRQKSDLYIVEGDKLVREYLDEGRCVKYLFATPLFLSSLSGQDVASAGRVTEVTDEELKQISSLTTPNSALALAEKREGSYNNSLFAGRLTLVLDNIRDPGNMGTILRLAAWYGIEQVICSPGCVDIYNPKVVQATMGALLHVTVNYHPLTEVLNDAAAGGTPVVATTLDGKPVYSEQLPASALILLGNESRGLSGELVPLVTDMVTIPMFGRGGSGIESLNVATAAAIIISEFMRDRQPSQQHGQP